MGLFSRNRTYSFANVKRMLQTDKYANYVAIPVSEGKYKLLQEEKEILESRERRIQKDRRQEKFRDEITGNGAYQNLGRISSNYNNYKNLNQYQQEDIFDLRR